MAGYLFRKWSTIFKGPWITYIKERRLARRITGHMHKIHAKLLPRIEDEVEKHRVTKALKDIEEIEKELDEVGEDEFKFLFDEAYQEEAVLGRINKIEERIILLIRKAKTKEAKKLILEIDKIFEKHLIKALKTVETYDKEEYQDILRLINEAKKDNSSTFMEKLKILTKDIDVSKWRRFPIRRNAVQFRKAIQKIKKDDNKIAKLEKEIDNMLSGKKVKDDFNSIKKKVEDLATHIEQHIIYCFFSAYKGMKRVLSIIYILFGYEDLIRVQMKNWGAKDFLPKMQINMFLNRLKGIRKKLSDNLHTIGQALIRIYHQEEGLKKKV